METITHEQLKEQVNTSYQTKIPLFVWGGVGIGKSESIKNCAIEIAKKEKLEFSETNTENGHFCFLDVRISQLEPSDLRGLPVQDLATNTTKWLTPNWLPKKKDSKGIIFFDELNLSPPSIQAVAYQLILDRRIGDYCYSNDTKVMTKNGLKFFKDLLYDDEIMTLNPKNKMVEYHKPIEIINLKYKGKMYNFKGSSVDLCVSPNHNLYVRRNDTTNKKFRFMKAKDLKNKAIYKFESIKYGKWNGKNKKYFEVPLSPEIKNIFKNYNLVMKLRETGLGSKKISDKLKLPISQIEKWIYYKHNPQNKFNMIRKFNMDDWVEFLGWYLSEGHTSKTHHYEISISQNKKINPIKYKLIENLLIRMGLKYRAYDNDLRFCSRIIGEYLKNTFGKSHNKFIPSNIKELSPKYLKKMITTLLMGDGNKMRRYYTISNKLKEDFCEIAIKCGYGITFSKKNNGVWDIGIVEKSTPIFKEVIEQDYDGEIYCVNVPNHILMTERNGKMVWSGNCLPDGWVIISAGNRMEDKCSVFEMSSALCNRFLHSELKTPDKDEWSNWALNNEIDSRIVAFINFKPSALNNVDEKNKDKAFPTPRSWSFCSKLISDKTSDKDLSLVKRLVGSSVGEATGIEFLAFLKLQQKINLNEILKKPKTIQDIKEIDLKYILLGTIAERYKKDKKILIQSFGLCDYLEPEFSILLLRFLKAINQNDFKKVITTDKKGIELLNKYADILK